MIFLFFSDDCATVYIDMVVFFKCFMFWNILKYIFNINIWYKITKNFKILGNSDFKIY